mmetsp:Transcript_4980/g.15846  ORF Transcript_4980/g.15846 Transcript_4980/m.15846 type:complete len:283 (+) Transcript_4980:313-1161(+)
MGADPRFGEASPRLRPGGLLREWGTGASNSPAGAAAAAASWKALRLAGSWQKRPEDAELADWLDVLDSDSFHFFESRKRKQEQAPPPPIQDILVADVTSLEVFISFTRQVVGPDGALQIDCSGILSIACYERWLATRRVPPSHPEECFRKSLISKVTRSDGGSAPFPPEIEAPLLKLLRRRQIWECFQGKLDSISGKPIRIGQKGMRSLGFHERENLAAEKRAGPPSSHASARAQADTSSAALDWIDEDLFSALEPSDPRLMLLKRPRLTRYDATTDEQMFV